MTNQDKSRRQHDVEKLCFSNVFFFICLCSYDCLRPLANLCVHSGCHKSRATFPSNPLARIIIRKWVGLVGATSCTCALRWCAKHVVTEIYNIYIYIYIFFFFFFCVRDMPTGGLSGSARV